MRSPARLTRAQARDGKQVVDRLWLLEEDADENDRQHDSLRDELRTTNKILLSLLITIASAAIVGALNLLFKAV